MQVHPTTRLHRISRVELRIHHHKPFPNFMPKNFGSATALKKAPTSDSSVCT